MKERLEDTLWRHFFTNPRINYNPYMVKLVEYPNHIIYDSEIMDSYRDNWNQKAFGNNNPVYLEIGSGSGNFAVGMAAKYPERNHLALEIRFKRLVLSATKAVKRNLNNVVFLRRRGEDITKFIGNEEIEGLYINFPDPWEGNEKNRILQPKLFELLDVIMKVDGTLFFKTDHDQYYSDVLEFAKDLKNYEVVYHTPDLHNSPKAADNIRTEFEDLFICKHNKNINYIEIKKIK